MTEALALHDISFSIGGVHLTQDVSLQLNKGDRMALMGPNGAGKTTLMNLVAGSRVPTRGRILLDGSDITTWSPQRRARKGLARTFQITNLLSTRTVEENLALAVGSGHPRRAHPFRSWRSMKDTWSRVDELVERSGLGDIRRRPVASLPYAEQRKLEIVVAVARPAKVVMLDEPGAGLTRDEAGALIELVFDLGEDVAVLFVDHDMQLVRRLATRMVLLELGQIVAEGSPADVEASDAFDRIYMRSSRRA